MKVDSRPAAAAARPYIGIGPAGLSPLVYSDPRVVAGWAGGYKTGIAFHSATRAKVVKRLEDALKLSKKKFASAANIENNVGNF